jgi:periplasmic protein TonB
MKSTSRIFGILFFVSTILLCSAQSFQPPKPRMSNNVYKDFIQMHLNYPEESLQKKEEGTVVLSFLVDENGQINNARVKQSVSKEIDSSAVQLVSLILWEPATEYGLAVASEKEFKLKYSISKYNSICKKRGYNEITYPIKPIDLSNKIYTISQLNKAPEALLDSAYQNVQEFIMQSLKYPEAATKLSIDGVVKLRFVIETSGLPSNILILEPVGGGCTEEAIRIVQQIKWLPGVKSDMAVRTCYELSIRFDPADELKNKNIPNQSNTGI